MKLNGNGANDQIQSTLSSITFGGTLQLANISASPYAAGQTNKIFNAASYGGTFAGITPIQPGPALKWNTSTLTSDGTLRVAVVPQPGISSTLLSGANLVISGTNGTPGLNYAVLTSTNVALPLASWTALVTNVFDGNGNFSYTNSSASPQQFFCIQAL